MRGVSAELPGCKPLAYFNGKLVVARGNALLLASLDLSSTTHLCDLPVAGGWRASASKARIFQRLLRFEAGPATVLDALSFLVFFRDQLFRVGADGTVSLETVPGLQRRPLRMLSVPQAAGPAIVYFGEYTGNFDFGPVNIYRRDAGGKWSTAYAFPAGEVNHIHGVFDDPERNRLLVLTGDFNAGAAIWAADRDFRQVRPLLRTGQLSRACWVASWTGRLFFATDRQDDVNYFCELHEQSGRAVRLFPIPGSSIYACPLLGDRLVFATAVEPVPSNSFSLRALLSRRPAPGMLGSRACVYAGNPETGFELVFSGEKDALPYGLFQFGAISFPAGTPPDASVIHVYCTALRGMDNKMFALHIAGNSEA